MYAHQSSVEDLSGPTRRKILDLLKEGDMTAGEIADHFQMTKPSISHHLNLPKQAELVWDERKGQHISYSLNTTVSQDLLKWVLQFQQPHTKEGGDLGWNGAWLS